MIQDLRNKVVPAGRYEIDGEKVRKAGSEVSGDVRDHARNLVDSVMTANQGFESYARRHPELNKSVTLEGDVLIDGKGARNERPGDPHPEKNIQGLITDNKQWAYDPRLNAVFTHERWATEHTYRIKDLTTGRAEEVHVNARTGALTCLEVNDHDTKTGTW